MRAILGRDSLDLESAAVYCARFVNAMTMLLRNGKGEKMVVVVREKFDGHVYIGPRVGPAVSEAWCMISSERLLSQTVDV